VISSYELEDKGRGRERREGREEGDVGGVGRRLRSRSPFLGQSQSECSVGRSDEIQRETAIKEREREARFHTHTRARGHTDRGGKSVCTHAYPIGGTGSAIAQYGSHLLSKTFGDSGERGFIWTNSQKFPSKQSFFYLITYEINIFAKSRLS
jgi:hypothetical protein